MYVFLIFKYQVIVTLFTFSTKYCTPKLKTMSSFNHSVLLYIVYLVFQFSIFVFVYISIQKRGKILFKLVTWPCQLIYFNQYLNDDVIWYSEVFHLMSYSQSFVYSCKYVNVFCFCLKNSLQTFEPVMWSITVSHMSFEYKNAR